MSIVWLSVVQLFLYGPQQQSQHLHHLLETDQVLHDNHTQDYELLAILWPVLYLGLLTFQPGHPTRGIELWFHEVISVPSVSANTREKSMVARAILKTDLFSTLFAVQILIVFCVGQRTVILDFQLEMKLINALKLFKLVATSVIKTKK